MSYPYLLFICLFMMFSIAVFMYYLGTKISYNYILYNASVSTGSGVIFFIAKMSFTMDEVGPIEQTMDIILTMLLATVWIISLIETFTVEVMENGREIKGNIITLSNKMKAIEMKGIPLSIAKHFNTLSVKAKTYLVKNKLTMKILKWISEYSKNRELNKRV